MEKIRTSKHRLKRNLRKAQVSHCLYSIRTRENVVKNIFLLLTRQHRQVRTGSGQHQVSAYTKKKNTEVNNLTNKDFI